MEHHDIEYLLTLACSMLATGGLFAAMAYVTARLARLSFKRALAISSYDLVALVVFRSLGYMAGSLITKGGDLLNYTGSLFGIHVYYPPALAPGVFRSLIPNTGYNWFAALLTVPLVLGLPLAWFLTYRTWRKVAPGPGRAALISLPAGVAAFTIVVVYEYFYLVGYRVIT